MVPAFLQRNNEQLLHYLLETKAHAALHCIVINLISGVSASNLQTYVAKLLLFVTYLLHRLQ